jgi:hypothetical protein
MTKTAHARFAIRSWDEEPYSDGQDRTCRDGQAKEPYSVIPGSATGEPRGLRGEGRSAVEHGIEHPFTLGYDLD